VGTSLGLQRRRGKKTGFYYFIPWFYADLGYPTFVG
jgi:hypothetical protein